MTPLRYGQPQWRYDDAIRCPPPHVLDTAPSPCLTASPDFDEVSIVLLEGEVSRIARTRLMRRLKPALTLQPA